MDLQSEHQFAFADWNAAVDCELPAAFLLAVVHVDWHGHVRRLFEFLFIIFRCLIVDLCIVLQDMVEEGRGRYAIVAKDIVIEFHVVLFVDCFEKLVA